MRLTEKLDEELPIYFAKDGNDEDETNAKLIIQKLGQLEDIEEDLEVSVNTLYHALTEGIYVKTFKGRIEFIGREYLVCDTKYLYSVKYCENYVKLDEHLSLYFGDYGKTWALTKNELM